MKTAIKGWRYDVLENGLEAEPAFGEARQRIGLEKRDDFCRRLLGWHEPALRLKIVEDADPRKLVRRCRSCRNLHRGFDDSRLVADDGGVAAQSAGTQR